MADNYRKKPIIIQAEQFKAGVEPWPFGVVNFGYPVGENSAHPLGDKHWVSTLEGPLIVSEGDYIIRGVKGEFYPCKPDIFEATYERA